MSIALRISRAKMRQTGAERGWGVLPPSLAHKSTRASLSIRLRDPEANMYLLWTPLYLYTHLSAISWIFDELRRNLNVKSIF